MGNSNILKISKTDREILNYLVEQYTIEELLSESKLGRKLLPYISAGILSLSPYSSGRGTERHVDRIEISKQDNSKMDMELINKKIEAATEYISDNLAKFGGRSINDVPFDISDLVIACHEKKYDLPLAMAQLQIESHFGTDGSRQEKTKSLFSVGLYDSGRNRKTYSTYKDAIDDYIKIMQEHYFQNGTVSIDELLTNFVDEFGHRYASNPNYEKSIKSTRNKIIKLYPELLEN